MNIASSEVSAMTISTWVYIPSEAGTAQAKRADEIDEHVAPKNIRNRIPIMQFGESAQPRSGIHISMGLFWEGYLGWFWWAGGLGMPSYPDYTGEIYIGGEDLSRDGWYPFGGGCVAYPSIDPEFGWKNAAFIIFGTAASGAGTAFYYMPVGRNIFPIIPNIRYYGFDDLGILEFCDVNDGPLGPYFAAYAGGDFYGDFAKAMTWTWSGEFRIAVVLDGPGRVAVLPGDICKDSHLINSEFFFDNFWTSEFNLHMQKTPTHDMGGHPYLRVDTGGTAKYFAQGDLVVVYPKLDGVSYGTPAIPSTLWYDGNLNFQITSKWPEENTAVDGEIVNSLTIKTGGFVPDSWNHIFISFDLSPMVLGGGQDDKELTMFIETLAGRQLAHIGLSPPEMQVPPKVAFVVNGKVAESVQALPQFTVFPGRQTLGTKNGPKWKDAKTFTMHTAGKCGIPSIDQEKGTWKATGPNQLIRYAYTHVYLNQYIPPTKENLSKFVWKSKNAKYNNVIPPPDKEAAVKAFGKPDIWLYRDKANGVEWKNQGTGSGLILVGSAPKDYRPGPGQPARKKP